MRVDVFVPFLFSFLSLFPRFYFILFFPFALLRANVPYLFLPPPLSISVVRPRYYDYWFGNQCFFKYTVGCALVLVYTCARLLRRRGVVSVRMFGTPSVWLYKCVCVRVCVRAHFPLFCSWSSVFVRACIITAAPSHEFRAHHVPMWYSNSALHSLFFFLFFFFFNVLIYFPQLNKFSPPFLL